MVELTQNIQLIYKLVIVLAYSLCATAWSVPYVIRKLKKFEYVAQDKYKTKKYDIPTLGGLAMLIGVLVSLALSQILLNQQDLGTLFIFYFIVVVYALYGVVDDLFGFKKRYDKILVLLVLTFPIASLVHDTQINLGFLHIEIGALYSLLVVPVYIMVVANMINLHAGYNGLTQGLSLLILITLGIKSYMTFGMEYLIYLLPVLGAVIAFLPYASYPARILPGNVGDFLVGAAIGCFIVTNRLLWFGIFILIPHIINFIMDTYTIAIRKTPDVKFGTLRKDGTIAPPPSMKYKSLKFLVCSWWRLTERQATLILYGLTAFFCVVGLIVF